MSFEIVIPITKRLGGNFAVQSADPLTPRGTLIGRHMSPLCTPKKGQHPRRGLRQCHLHERQRTTVLNSSSHQAA
jgi:hypothetical protein